MRILETKKTLRQKKFITFLLLTRVIMNIKLEIEARQIKL